MESKRQKFPQVFRILLSIQVDLGNAVVWMVSARPPISNSSSSLIRHLGTVIIIIIQFSVLLSVSYNPSRNLYLRPMAKVANDYMHSVNICFFLSLLGFTL